MTCAELQWADRGTRPLSAEEQAHVAGCEGCQADLAVQRALRAGEPSSDPLSAQILAQAHAELARAPRAGSWTRPWLLGSALALVAALAAAPMLHLRHDWAALPLADVMVNLVLLAAAFVFAGRAAFEPGLVPRGRATAAALAIAAAGALLALPGPRGGLPGGHWACFAILVGIGAVPLLALFALVRARSRAWLTGVCVGLAAGALGEGALFVACPFSGMEHLLATHLSAWLVLGALGGALVALFPKRLWMPQARRP